MSKEPGAVHLLSDHLAPRLIGKDAERVEAIWRELEFATHATTVGAISSLALSAIDTALWDLRAKRRRLPLWIIAGGAADRRPLYTTEGGWLHIDESALVEDALAAREKGFMGSKIKIGRPHVSEDYQRLAAVRAALGLGYEIMTDDLAVMRRIDELHLELPFYGSRRMTFELNKEGRGVNRKRVRRLMRVMGIEALVPRPGTSKAAPGHKIYPYLLRGLKIVEPNHVWAADVSVPQQAA